MGNAANKPTHCLLCKQAADKCAALEQCVGCGGWVCTSKSTRGSQGCKEKHCLERKHGTTFYGEARYPWPTCKSNSKSIWPLELEKMKDFQVDAERYKAAAPSSTLICGECKVVYIDFWNGVFERNMADILRKAKLEKYLEAQEEESSHVTFKIEQPDKDAGSISNRALIASYDYLIPMMRAAGWLTGTGVLTLACDGIKYSVAGAALTQYLTSLFSLDASVYTLLKTIAGVSGKAHEAIRASTKPGSSAGFYDATQILIGLCYLWAKHNLKRIERQDSLTKLLKRKPSVDMAIIERCGLAASKADWLYTIRLTGVHDTGAWREWYLSKVLDKQGYILACSSVLLEEGDSTRKLQRILPSTARFEADSVTLAPIFLLALPKDSSRDKEVILSIQGTSNIGDALIDLEHQSTEFALLRRDGGAQVKGHLHEGMYRSADCLLKHCHVYDILEKLFAKGFSLHIIGHSLGAGIAAIVAMMLHNKYAHESHPPNIKATGFGTPAAASAEIATFCRDEGLFVSVVNNTDIVPRLSWSNLCHKEGLIPRVKEYMPKAERQFNSDFEKLRDCALTVGAAPTVREKETRNPFFVVKSSDSHGFKSLSVTPGKVATGQAMAEEAGEEGGGEVGAAGVAGEGMEEERQQADSEAEAQSQTAREGEATWGESCGEDASRPELFAPGIIVYLHETSGGPVESCIVDKDADEALFDKLFRRIKLSRGCVEDHSLKAYMRNLRAVMFRRAGTAAAIASANYTPPTMQPAIYCSDGDTEIPEDWTPERVGAPVPLMLVGYTVTGPGIQKNTTVVSAAEGDGSELKLTISSKVDPSFSSPTTPSFAFAAPPDKSRSVTIHGTLSSTETASTFAIEAVGAVEGIKGSFVTGVNSAVVAAGTEMATVVEVSGRCVTLSRAVALPARDDGSSSSASASARVSLTFSPKKGPDFTGVTAKIVPGKSALSACFLFNLQWSKCYVCDLDPTWPFVTKSALSRALYATHNCSVCGKIICTLCGRAGDQIPGEAGQYDKLDDLRLSLPLAGPCVPPQRVCLPCYHSAFSDELAAVKEARVPCEV